MTVVEAVVFDLDGTLIDSEIVWDEVRRGLAAEDRVPWPDGTTEAMMGMSTQEWSAHLADVVGVKGTPREIARRTIDAMLERYAEGVPVLPGAAEAIERIGARWTLGVASSSPRLLIDRVLATLGLTDHFASTLSTEELDGAGKPAPDVFLESCRRLGVEPHRAAAVEDSPNGIRAAHAAGMKVVIIPPHFQPPTAEVLALGDVVLDSLDDLTVDLVAGLLREG